MGLTPHEPEKTYYLTKSNYLESTFKQKPTLTCVKYYVGTLKANEGRQPEIEFRAQIVLSLLSSPWARSRNVRS